ncbi:MULTISPECIES: hypothetical protein [Actinoalloteichus]|uniref:Uncharacterized protein n=1 Tax=Actinoalloteichus fjordicus TaxID=1612552 RepID=A0AAC9L9Q9_9PSEU|nr:MULTISPECIES: hypothetical protein [Actinoalloteichus]APU13798.1 hypothetical protein UA74_08670 [Actinoalloteichus fjordicus]APU19744.1 hypothetical protein UA75_08640 [Actinoalloteichus sp. GBA129-24]
MTRNESGSELRPAVVDELSQTTSESIPVPFPQVDEVQAAETAGPNRAERRRAGKKNKERFSGHGLARQPRIAAAPPRQFAHRRRG